MKSLIFLFVALLFVACSERKSIEKEALITEHQELIKDKTFSIENVNSNDYLGFVFETNLDSVVMNDPMYTDPFEEFMNKYKSLSIDGEIYYVVEGDLLMDEDELFQYFIKNVDTDIAYYSDYQKDSDKLLGIMRNGNLIKAPNPQKIKYAIVRNSFSSIDKYNQTVQWMQDATNDWSAICNVSFEYQQLLDEQITNSSYPDELYFVVREFPAGGSFIAKAFFPFHNKRRRKILLDPTFFTSRFQPEGVLRHELGHTLGFLHEHIRSEAPAECYESSQLTPAVLTQYDPQSVMHYFCGGVGSQALELSEKDMIGAQLIYGLPI